MPRWWLGCLTALLSVAAVAAPRPGNVIFIHPDGTALNGWVAARALWVGPDGLSDWDRLPHVGLYRAHFADGFNPSSHGGATIHAWGRKVGRDSYGLDGTEPIRSRSGAEVGLMQEAQAAGLAVGVVQSGHLAEPGTGVFLATSETRRDATGIAAQIVAAGAEVVLGGGEIYLLPRGEMGFFGHEGVRTDGRNLLQEARAAGYTVVFTREALAEAVAEPTTRKVLGVFAAVNTYHDRPQEELEAAELPHYDPAAPTVAEMTEAALAVLARADRRFFLVVEEEGTDNFANKNNAAGTLEAFRRANEAIGVARRFLASREDTLLLTGADSDAGGLQMIGRGVATDDAAAPPQLPGGMHGVAGEGTTAFVSAPDREGRRFYFGILWAGSLDYPGGIVSRAEGLNAERLPVNLDNTDLFVLMWETLFGRELP